MPTKSLYIYDADDLCRIVADLKKQEKVVHVSKNQKGAYHVQYE